MRLDSACVSPGGVRVVAAVLVSGPTLHSLLQLVDQTHGAAGEGLEADGDDGELRLARATAGRSFSPHIASVSSNTAIIHAFKAFFLFGGNNICFSPLRQILIIGWYIVFFFNFSTPT